MRSEAFMTTGSWPLGGSGNGARRKISPREQQGPSALTGTAGQAKAAGAGTGDRSTLGVLGVLEVKSDVQMFPPHHAPVRLG